MQKWKSLLALAWLLTLITAGCDGPRHQAAESELLVAAAANMSEPLTQLGPAFEAQTGQRVKFGFGATGTLAKQVENGAPFDLFIAADVATIDRLIQSGKLSGESKRIYARGTLALWTRAESGVSLTQLGDLTKPEFKHLAVANPELAPYGRAAVEALQASHLLAAVQPKIVYGESVTQTRQFAESGNAEAAFIPLSFALHRTGKFIEVDERLHQPLNQALAEVADSRRREAARRFAEFITGPEGRRILSQYGYRMP